MQSFRKKVKSSFCLFFLSLKKKKKYNILYLKNNNNLDNSIKDKSDINIYLRKIWNKFLPAAFGGGILQINLLVDTILATLLGFGSVSYLYFADRVAQLPLGVIGVALSTSLLTSLSKSSAIDDVKQFSYELITSLKIGIYFSIPSLFVIINFSDLIITVLFGRGEFGLVEVNNTSQALKAYALGIPAFIILKSCQPAFLAEGDTKTPMYIGFILLFINIILSVILMNYFFHAGIALATSISSWIGSLIYLTLLIKNEKILKPKITFVDNTPNLFSLLLYKVKIIAVSLFMILIMKYSLNILKIYEINKFWSLLTLIVLGLTMYLLTTRLLSYIPQELLKIMSLKYSKDK